MLGMRAHHMRGNYIPHQGSVTSLETSQLGYAGVVLSVSYELNWVREAALC